MTTRLLRGSAATRTPCWPPAASVAWREWSASRWPPATARAGSAWIKVKNVRHQEVIICGWRPGQGRRVDATGSLLLGVSDHGRLRYAGNVGTGFTGAMLADLIRQLAALRRDTSPFATPVPPRYARGAHWVQPRLVGEVAFTEWIAGGSMRHPGWRGLRAGKNPKTYPAKAGHLGTVRARGPASGPGSAGRDPA